MQELIKIENRVIGAEETNAVSARELHKSLEIKKDFTNWIKAQIDRAGLRENVDYIIVSQKVEAGKGVSTRKEYIITTDASKHIAMMSQGAKAKEVRDYFIAVEKEYKAMSSASADETQILPVLQSIVQMVSMIVTTQEKMMEMMQSMQEQQNKSQNRMRLRALAIIQTPDAPITARQIDAIRDAVSKRASELYKFHNMDSSKITHLIFSDLNKKFSTKSYHHIKQGDYVPAMLFVRNLELFNY